MRSSVPGSPASSPPTATHSRRSPAAGSTGSGRPGVEVITEVEGDAARALNAPYLKRLLLGLPFVTAKWAMTLDGRTAASTGDSRWISNPRSRALVHEGRGRMDAILVGVGTALADDPELTARPPGPRAPARVVLDGALRLPVAGKLALTARSIPVWVATTQHAPLARIEALQDLGCVILRFEAEGTRAVPVVPLLRELAGRGVTNLLIEGGGVVLGSFFDAGQVDAVDVFIAPRIEGGPPRHTPAQGRGFAAMADAWRLDRPTTTLIDGDVRVEGRVAGAPWAEALHRAAPDGDAGRPSAP